MWVSGDMGPICHCLLLFILILIQCRSFALDMDAMPPVPDWMKDFTGSDGGGAKEKMERDAICVGEPTDELSVAIALLE